MFAPEFGKAEHLRGWFSSYVDGSSVLEFQRKCSFRSYAGRPRSDANQNVAPNANGNCVRCFDVCLWCHALSQVWLAFVVSLSVLKLYIWEVSLYWIPVYCSVFKVTIFVQDCFLLKSAEAIATWSRLVFTSAYGAIASKMALELSVIPLAFSYYWLSCTCAIDPFCPAEFQFLSLPCQCGTRVSNRILDPNRF